MHAFDDVKFGWKGHDYVIPADRVLGAIRRVEDVITLGELGALGAKLPMGKIASAYAFMLRYAGANVTDDEVYLGMFGEAQSEAMQLAVFGLMGLMVPPNAKAVEAASEENPTQSRAGKGSSRSSSKRSSAKAG